jgi:serine/threonine protein kinase
MDSGYTRRGTVAFMAPEIYYGTQGGYYPSKAADVFSFSMMMYEVLTGVHLTKPLEQGTFGFYVYYFIFVYCSSIH